MPQPQIILIGGPPGAGKTTLARHLASRLRYLATTVDDLVSTARIVTERSTHPAFHQGRGEGHVAYFTNSSVEDLITEATNLSIAMWPVIERVIARHLDNETPVVFDWWLFTPEVIRQLNEPRVASLWLYVDPDVLRQREQGLDAFYGASHDPERMLSNFMERSLWRNDLVRQQAASCGLPVLHQTGDRSVDELCAEACDKLGIDSTENRPGG